MGGFSIWHWVIVLLVVLLEVQRPVLPDFALLVHALLS